ncbi:hypothetical protein ACFR9U_10210 [Halorientalis brevis]|uniref:LexA-binding, inner membrane-associated hydrolase n=1 Tax=Halorientalis brevis TaxID=1126241 RepID=A0ABD6CD97_9EURY|nr:hypothetical protein [Halorientalis brevis]
MVLAAVVVVLVEPPVSPLLVVGYGAALGVLVDLDHFLLARRNTGSWRATVAVVENPRLLLFEQEAIFEDGEVGAVRRLASHAVITVGLVAGLAPVSSSLAIVTGVVLLGHILSDVVYDFTPVFGPPHTSAR